MKLTGRTRKVLAFVLLFAMTISSVQFAFANTTDSNAGDVTQASERASQGNLAQGEVPNSVNEKKHSLDEPHFAVVAMNEDDGLIFEPHNIWVTDSDSLLNALKNSGHKFENLDDNLKKIDGKGGNYLRYYNGDKYDLDALGKDAGTIVFTERLDSDVKSKEYQALVALLADHRSKSEEERQFDDVREAYEKAIRGLATADKDKAVVYTNELKAAYQKYNDWTSQEKAQVSFLVSKNGDSVGNANVSVSNKYGKKFTGTSASPLALNSGSYTFVVSDGQNEISGSFDVKAAEKKTIVAPLMEEAVIGKMNFSSVGSAKNTLEITTSGQNSTLKALDVDSDLYANIATRSGISSSKYKLYADYTGVYDGKYYGDESDSKNAIPWESSSKKLKNVIKYGTSTDGFRLKVVHKLNNGFIQRQYYQVDIERIPTLSKLNVTDENGNKVEMNFNPYTQSYSFDTTSDKLTFDIDSDRTIAGESFGSPDDGYLLTVDEQIVDAGKYEVDVADGSTSITVTNMYTYEENTYKIEFRKVTNHKVVIKKEKGVDVKLVNNMGGNIKADEIKDTEVIFHVGAGDYEWVSTLDKDYHAKGSIKVEAGKKNSFEAKTPIKEALIKSLSTHRAYNNEKSTSYKEINDKNFDWKDHSYQYVVPDYSELVNLAIDRVNSDVSITRGEYTTYEGTNAVINQWGKNIKSEVLYRFISVGGLNNSVRVTASKKVGETTYYQDYKISTVRKSTLNSLELRDNYGKAIELCANGNSGFRDNVNTYKAEVPSDAESIDLSLVFPGENKAKELVGKYVARIRGTEIARSEDGSPVSTSIALDSNKDKEDIEIEVIGGESGNLSNKYTIEVSKSAPVAVKFNTNPSDCRINIKNEKYGKFVTPEEDGSFMLVKGTSYTYTVTHTGYLPKTKTFKQQDETDVNITLEKAPVNTKLNTDLNAEWPYFRYDANNNCVVNFPLPRDASEATLYWATKFGSADMYGSLGCPIMVNGYIYNYSGTTILKFDSMTGEVVKKGKMSKRSSFAINSPTYADGMIFVGLEGGTIQAFDAETLESLWIYHAPTDGQPNCPISYKDGYIYTGFWKAEDKKAEYVCLSVTDEDPTRTDEIKTASWVHEGKGFYWAGAYVGNGNAGEIEIASKQARTYIVVGSDDGKTTADAYGELLSLDPITGRAIDSIDDTFLGDIRSTIMFDKDTARYYFVTKGGYFCSVKLNEDGTFDRSSIKTLSLMPKNATKKYIPMSASTPVIYKGRAYIGVGGSSNFGDYSGHNISVIDIKSNTIAYSIETKGYPQASSILTTAYEKDDDSVYVYFFENKTPGALRVIKDRPGQTAPSEVAIEKTSNQKMHQVAPVLFTPVGNHAQYVICSPIADEYGNIYFKNDSSHMFMIGPTIKELRIVKNPDKTEYLSGETFDPTGMKVEAVYSNGKTRDVTKYISYNNGALDLSDEDFEIRLKTGAQMYQDKDGKTGVKYTPPTAILDLTIKLKRK